MVKVEVGEGGRLEVRLINMVQMDGERLQARVNELLSKDEINSFVTGAKPEPLYLPKPKLPLFEYDPDTFKSMDSSLAALD